MHWYERTAQKLEPDQRYSRQALVSELRQDNPQLRESSFHWAISGMLHSGSIIKTGYPNVLQEAMHNWHVEKQKLLRYARRRGKEEEIRRILEVL